MATAKPIGALLSNPASWMPGSPVRMLAVLLVAAVLAWLTITHTIAAVSRNINPALALRFSPADAGANATLADRLLQLGKREEDDRVADHARQALSRSPLSPVAVRSLGLVAELQGDLQRGRALMLQSAMLSKRDLATRLWMIERAVARDDVPGALAQFDIAMRSSDLARSILSPILVNAIADATFVDPVTDLFRNNPNWAGNFVMQALPTGKATENLAVIVARTTDVQVPYADIRQAVLDQLVNEAKFAAAANFYAKVSGQGSTTSVQQPRFEAERAGFRPFIWTFPSQVGFGAERGSGGIEFFAKSASGGVVASQLLTLSPGRYRLATLGYSRSQDSYGGAEWTIDCAGADDRTIARLALSSSNRPVRQVFDVPRGCAGQWLRLSIRPAQTPDGVTGIIREVRVQPLSR